MEKLCSTVPGRQYQKGTVDSVEQLQFSTIMEETLTSGEYVPLFLISILNMHNVYIWNLKNYVTTGVFLKK